MPCISIIVPVYNAERYLKHCIDSILQQTEQDFELLLVDDGSTDGSGQICEDYAAAHSGIRVIRQQNAGVSAARNAGLKTALGDYIVFVDADDRAEPDYLRVLLGNMQKGGMSACEWISEGERLRKSEITERLNKEEAQISAFSYKGIEGYPFCKMFDKALIRRNRIFFDTEIAMCEDLLFVIRYLSCITADVVREKSTHYYYRSNPEGALLARFSPNGAIDRGMLTEVLALERCRMYTVGKKAERACDIRSTKAAVVTLRAITAKQYRNARLYKKLIKRVRRYCLPYVVSGIGALSAKTSVLLCAVSPRLEYRVWKRKTERHAGKDLRQ